MPIVRTLIDLFRIGAHYTAENIVRAGHGIAELIRALRGRPNVDLQSSRATLSELIGRARQSVENADLMNRRTTIQPANMPIDPSQDIRGFYQYRVIIKSRIRIGEAPENIEEIRTALRIPSDLPLTPEELLDIAEGMARNRRMRPESPPLLKFAHESGRIIDTEVVTIISGYRPPRART